MRNFADTQRKTLRSRGKQLSVLVNNAGVGGGGDNNGGREGLNGVDRIV